MGHPSTAEFRSFHALRIKGFASVDTLAEMTDTPPDDVRAHLDAMSDGGLAVFREARSLWQLTPDGRAAHPDRLAADLAGAQSELGGLAAAYRSFLELNAEFKELCGRWQLRDGEMNDHTDAAYDSTVVGALDDLHGRALPVVAAAGERLDRLAPYAARLGGSLERLHAGHTNMFTGVMCGSYHDVWMELHEDLILTLGIDRTAEGSF